MPLGARSSAAQRVNMSSAALLAQYIAQPAKDCCPLTELTLTMDAPTRESDAAAKEARCGTACSTNSNTWRGSLHHRRRRGHGASRRAYVPAGSCRGSSLGSWQGCKPPSRPRRLAGLPPRSPGC
eukprot:scaffold7639_cov258-Pinguiococcus_pyrenoidosus.AAC.3